jgi:CubicO group peptidase (beta-lactamase class C family)
MRTLEREFPPGEKFEYKTGETHLLGDLVRAATGRNLSDYLSEKVWQPYGMESDASWQVDATGSELAGCCLQATLRDFARSGQFVLNGGLIHGETVVAPGWFEEATRAQVDVGFSGVGYGYQWWTFADRTFSAKGIHG